MANPHGNPAPRGNRYAVKNGPHQIAFSMSLSGDTRVFFARLAQAQGIADPTDKEIVQVFKAWVKEQAR